MQGSLPLIPGDGVNNKVTLDDVREAADWAASVPNTPATPQNFVCPMCSAGAGP